VVFQLPNTYYFCSTPKAIERNLSFSAVQEEMITALSQRGRKALTKESLYNLTEELEQIGKKRKDIYREAINQNVGADSNASSTEEEKLTEQQFENHKKIVRELYSNRHPIELVSYYSSIYLDSQLIIVQHG